MQSGWGCNAPSWPLEALVALHQCSLQSYLSAGFFFPFLKESRQHSPLCIPAGRPLSLIIYPACTETARKTLTLSCRVTERQSCGRILSWNSRLIPVLNDHTQRSTLLPDKHVMLLGDSANTQITFKVFCCIQ